MTVASEEGVGTVFRIYLPEVTGSAAAGHRLAAEETPTGTETVVLVEDDDGLRRVADRILTRLGYHVTAFADGERALEYLLRGDVGEVDLLCTDLVLPGMSGRDLWERVLASRPGLKVLFASGYTEDVILRHGLLKDKRALVHKPFTPTRLGQMVREIIDGPGSAEGSET